MATYFVTVDFLSGDSPGLTRTQNVVLGDTIIVDFRGTGPEDFSSGSNVNCSVTDNGSSPILLGGIRFTVNNFSGSSHSSVYSDDEGDSWSLTGSVSSGGVTPGSNTYGLEVEGPNGAIVFSPDFKVCNLAVLTAFSIPAGGVANFPCDSAQFANKVVTIVDTGSRFSNQKITVTRQTNNIRLTNTHTSAIAGQLVAIRIA